VKSFEQAWAKIGTLYMRKSAFEITFSREGRTGTRMIRVSPSAENAVSTVSTVSTVSIVSAARNQVSRRSSHPCRSHRINTSRADDADGADANVAFRFRVIGNGGVRGRSSAANEQLKPSLTRVEEALAVDRFRLSVWPIYRGRRCHQPGMVRPRPPPTSAHRNRKA
jgi:hypothetical protein